MALDARPRQAGRFVVQGVMHFMSPLLKPVIALCFIAVITACSSSILEPSPTNSPGSAVLPSPMITLSPTPTAAPKSCDIYTWAYGTVPPEFINQVQDAMTAAGIEGTVKASTYGENNGECGYIPMAVDYIFTAQVASLEVSADLASTASNILDIAKRFVGPGSAPSLGHLRLIFQAKDQQCEWFYRDDAWNSARSFTSNAVTCPVPTSPESQRLADMLTVLSSDLACETSTVTGNPLQAVLECERSEGQTHYLATITLRLNGQSYAQACFHGYKSSDTKMPDGGPGTVIGNGITYFARDGFFNWTANGILFALHERVEGGQNIVLPSDTREKVFARAVQAGLIPGEGNSCP